MKNKKPSTRQNSTYSKEQSKHLKRIRSFIKSAEERGYRFYDQKIPKSMNMKAGFDEYQIPKTVKNPTAVTVNRLEKITKEYLYDRALWIDPETGLVYSGKEGRHIERSRAAQKAAETRRKNTIPPPDVNLNLQILDDIRNQLDMLQSLTRGEPSLTEYKSLMGGYLVGMFDDIVEYEESSGDLYEYASYLESRADEILSILDNIMNTSDRAQTDINITALMSIINRGALSPSQVDSITDFTESMGYGGGAF